MGRPILYIPGISTISDVATIASLNILGQVAKKVASYQSRIIVPNRDPIVLPVTQDVVKLAFTEAGFPQDYREDDIYFVTNDQFAYAAAVCGTMVREKPGANLLLGMFYAESLILAETGASTGAIQIAGTDAVSQLPFFVTACDYTIIGEELYAASAYIGREPTLLGSLKGQDIYKLICIAVIVLGVLSMTAGVLLPGRAVHDGSRTSCACGGRADEAPAAALHLPDRRPLHGGPVLHAGRASRLQPDERLPPDRLRLLDRPGGRERRPPPRRDACGSGRRTGRTAWPRSHRWS